MCITQGIEKNDSFSCCIANKSDISDVWIKFKTYSSAISLESSNFVLIAAQTRVYDDNSAS
jgi:hypothetical protein